MSGRAKVTKLSGQEIVVSARELCAALWLIKKYTSLAYVRRMLGLYANFVAGYEEFVSKKTAGLRWYRQNLRNMYAYQSRIREGLDKIERGEGAGYEDVRRGCYLDDDLRSRRYDHGLSFQDIGWRDDCYQGPHVGLYAWADVAMRMARRVRRTLEVQWAFPRIVDPSRLPFNDTPLDFELPPGLELEPKPRAAGPKIATREPVPIRGIWLPLNVPSASPNYLVAWGTAPQAVRAAKRLDWPAFRGPPPTPAYSEFGYAAVPCQWQLLWEDRRYEGGARPDESEYLDPTTEPPPWPPRAEVPASSAVPPSTSGQSDGTDADGSTREQE